MRVYNLRSRCSPPAPLRSPQSPKSRKSPRAYNIRSRRSPLAPLRSTQSLESRKPPTSRKRPGPTPRGKDLTKPVGDDEATGYSLKNLPPLRLGMMPEDFVKEVKAQKLRLLRFVPDSHDWLQQHLSTIEFTDCELEISKKKPTRRDEERILKELQLPFNFDNSDWPGVKSQKSQKLRALDQLTKEERWELLLKNTVVSGPNGCWHVGDTVHFQYPSGFRAKSHPMKKLSGIELSLHVIAASLGIYAPWIKFTMDSQILKGHGKWDVSHLCGHGHCFRPSHLVIEMSSTNQRRRDCKGGETCRCGYREGTPKCFGHEECPDTCPVRLRMLLKKKWKNDDWERALDIQEAGGAKAKVRCRVVDPLWYRDLIAYEEALANPIRSSKRKRKANDEPAEEPKKKANTATTRAQRRVSNRKTKLRRH